MPYQITFEWNDDDFYQDAVQKVSRLPTPEVLAEKSAAALHASIETIHDIGEQMATALSRLPQAPGDVTLEFGIKLGADAGVITKGQENAHFLIKLVWHSDNS